MPLYIVSIPSSLGRIRLSSTGAIQIDLNSFVAILLKMETEEERNVNNIHNSLRLCDVIDTFNQRI